LLRKNIFLLDKLKSKLSLLFGKKIEKKSNITIEKRFKTKNKLIFINLLLTDNIMQIIIITPIKILIGVTV
jgi:hypothetical protein